MAPIHFTVIGILSLAVLIPLIVIVRALNIFIIIKAKWSKVIKRIIMWLLEGVIYLVIVSPYILYIHFFDFKFINIVFGACFLAFPTVLVVYSAFKIFLPRRKYLLIHNFDRSSFTFSKPYPEQVDITILRIGVVQKILFCLERNKIMKHVFKPYTQYVPEDQEIVFAPFR
ncbi:MAG: hypothetical protein P1P90_00975 [Patescibacteria group bacterium]|nr:hypothetical protein [Patescibacteria group bacterium]